MIIYLRQHFEYVRLFEHLDRASHDGRVFMEEYNQGVKSLPMLNMQIELKLDDFRRIKQRNNGYFSQEEFVDYMWRNNRISITERPREMDEIQ